MSVPFLGDPLWHPVNTQAPILFKEIVSAWAPLQGDGRKIGHTSRGGRRVHTSKQTTSVCRRQTHWLRGLTSIRTQLNCCLLTEIKIFERSHFSPGSREKGCTSGSEKNNSLCTSYSVSQLFEYPGWFLN